MLTNLLERVVVILASGSSIQRLIGKRGQIVAVFKNKDTIYFLLEMEENGEIVAMEAIDCRLLNRMRGDNF